MRSGSIYGRLRRASHRLRSPELEPGVEFGAWSPWSSFWRGLIWHNAGSTRGRTGRRLCRSEERCIIFAALFFGVCTLITAFATDVQQLLIIRFITGVGLGAAMPNAIALISEYSPKRRHAIMVMVMFCGFSLGAALGGLVAGVLVPTFGWRSVFIFGGVVPLLLVPVLIVALPESVRFLLLRDPG